MGRPIRKHQPVIPRAPEIRLTSLVDITFQLIVFLLVVNDLSQREWLDLELPQSTTAHEGEDCGPVVRVTVNLPRKADPAAPPRFVVGGHDLSKRDLQLLLQATADRAREEEPTTGGVAASKAEVLIRADRGAPWGDAQHVLEMCAHEHVGIYRVAFAAQAEELALAGVR